MSITLGNFTAWLLALSLGCTGPGFSQSTWTPLPGEETGAARADPVCIAIIDSNEGVFDTAEWAFIKRRPPWDPLARALSNDLARPVFVRQLKRFQIVHHLAHNMCQFALIPRDLLPELRDKGVRVHPLATPRVHRVQGLLVANARSDITSLAQLRGRRCAFGPRKDPVLFYRALEVLDKAGISPSDLQQEFVIAGFEGSLQNHPTSREAAREIVYAFGTDAGVISADEYLKFPDTGGRWLPLFYSFSKDQFRILARTEEVEAETIRDAVLVAQADTPMELVHDIQETLVRAHVRNPEALHALGYACFDPPDVDESGAVANTQRRHARTAAGE